jgi:hypothetical protein
MANTHRADHQQRATGEPEGEVAVEVGFEDTHDVCFRNVSFGERRDTGPENVLRPFGRKWVAVQ